jgi:uncharacterized protein YggU (UPF0235/DUF167 family)
MKYEIEVVFHKDFVKVEGNKIIFGLSSKPEHGKANLELTKKLAKHFNFSSSQVKILSGLKSKRKIVEVIEE